MNAQDDYVVNAQKATYGSYNHPKMVWTFDYSMGFGTGELKDFISDASFRGFYMDGRGFINDNISIGGGIGWNVFYQDHPRATYEFDGGAITGQRWDYFFVMPLLVNAHYYFTHQGQIQPRVGISTGGYYTEREVQIGNLYVQDHLWKYGITPEVEVYLPFGISDWGLNLSAKYNFLFYNDDKMDMSNYFSLNVGFTFEPF
jgi:hypothetical protein